MPRTSGLTIDLNNYSAFKRELETLDKVIADIDKRIDTTSDSFDKLENAVDKTGKSSDKFEKEFKDAANTVTKETKNIDDGISRLQRTAQTLENIGTRVSIGISAPAAAIKALALDAAISFESAFAGVEKTLNTTGLSAEQAEAALEGIRDGLRGLATDVNSPLAGLANAHEELARIAELGSQLGIARDELLEFTETIGQLTLTTDLTADAAATNLAQFANIMQSTNFKGMGDAIVELGNNSATTESMIVEFGQRLAAAGMQAGFSEADVLGFGAAMASLGLNAEAGGTAMTRVINEMIAATANFETTTVSASSHIANLEGNLTELQSERLLVLRDLESAQDRLNRATNVSSRNSALTAVERETAALAALDAQISGIQGNITGLDGVSTVSFSSISDNLRLFAEIAGVSAEEFAAAFEEDAAGAIQMFVAGLSELDSGDLLTKLETLGLSDVRVMDTLRRLASNPQLLADSLSLANDAFVEGGALQTEAMKRFETTAAQINLLKNNVRDLAISLGDALLPGLNATIDVLVTFIQGFQDASPEAFRFAAALLGIAAAAGPAILILSQVVGAFAALGTVALPPLWLIVGAIAAVGIVIHDIRNNVGGAGEEFSALGENVSAFFSTLTDIGAQLGGAFQWFLTLMPQVEQSFSPVAAALSFINNQITNLTSGLGAVRDFLGLFNAAQGNMAGGDTQADSERNRLLDERRRIYEDINRLQEEGVATQAEMVEHQVASGDTLWDIAQRYGTTVEELMRLNDLDSSLITVGQELIISEGTTSVASEELTNLQAQAAAIEEQLRFMPESVLSAFDAFAETPLFERIFGTDEGARDRALVALANMQIEANELKSALGEVGSGFLDMISGDFEAGWQRIKDGFADVKSSIFDMFDIFNSADEQFSNPLVAATGDVDMTQQLEGPLVSLTGDMAQTETGAGILASIQAFGSTIISALEDAVSGDFSSVQTLLTDNLGLIFDGAMIALGLLLPPPMGIVAGLAGKLVDALGLDFEQIGTLFAQSSIGQSISQGFQDVFGTSFTDAMSSLSANLFGGGDTPLVALTGDMGAGQVAEQTTNPLQGLLNTVENIVNGFKNLDTSGITTFFDNLLGPIGDVADATIIEGIKSLIEGIGAFFSTFTEDLDTDALGSAALNIATVLGAIGGLVMGLMGAGMDSVGTALEPFGAFLADIINFITQLISLDFEAALNSLVEGFGNLILTVGGIVEGSFDGITTFIEAVTGWEIPDMHLVDMLSEMGDIITEVGGKILTSGIQGFFDFVTDITTGNFESTGLGQFLSGLPDMFATAFTEASNWVMLKFNEMKLTALEAIDAIPGLDMTEDIASTQLEITRLTLSSDAMTAISTDDFAGLTDTINQAMAQGIDLSQLNLTGIDAETLSGLATTMTPEELSNFILGIEPSAAGAMVYDSLNQAITDAAMSGDTDLATTLMQGLAGTFNEDAMTALVDEMAAAGGTDFATDFIENTLVPELESTMGHDAALAMGADLIAGLSEGLTEGQEQLATDTTAMGETIQTTFQDQFGVESPSLWFQEQGYFLLEGLALGMQEGVPLLEFVFIMLQEQFGVIVLSLNAMFDTLIAQERLMITTMQIAGQVWGAELKGMEIGIGRVGRQLSGIIPKIIEFMAYMSKIPAISIISLGGVAPGTPPPAEAVATIHASGGPGFAGAIAKIAEPEIGGIEIIAQDGGGTYIVSGKDFTAYPPMAAPTGALPSPPPASSSGGFAGGTSFVFNQPVIIENPSGGDVTPETIAAGLQRHIEIYPPRRDMRGSL